MIRKEGFGSSFLGKNMGMLCVGRKIQFTAALSSSLIINLVLAFYIYHDKKFDISWSWSAAEEAEVVAATPCSGHGRAFLDGPVEEGNRHVCECYSCYSGPDCSQFSDCPADADRYVYF